MAGRRLRATPSTPSDLSAKQDNLLKEFEAIFDEYQDKRQPLSTFLCDYEDKYRDDIDALKDSVKSKLEDVGYQAEFIDAHLKTTFPEATLEVIGMRTISPMHFSFKPDSLWRGYPSNHTVRKLARSIIVSGFRSDSVVSSRTLSFSGKPFCLSLGDGSARLIAAAIVWKLLSDTVLRADDEGMQNLVYSLSAVHVNFEKHGTGTAKECLIAQASRQNQAAAVLPVSTMQWISMIRTFIGQPIGSNFKSTSQVSQVLEEMIEAYNKHAEVVAYDVDSAPLRKRQRRAKQSADEDMGDSGLRIGRRRLLSMKSFLSGGNDEVLDEVLKHIVVVGDYKCSAISDDILQNKQIYIGSKLAKDQVPSEAQRVALHAAGDVVKSWLPGDETAEIEYDAPLSQEQFCMLWRKMIKSYETAIEGLSSPDAKLRERPSVEDWVTARRIVQLWDSAVEPVASKALSAEDFSALKTLILESVTLDAELASVLERMPKYFHMGLIPSISIDEAESVDSVKKRLAAAESAAEDATFEVADGRSSQLSE